MEVKPLSEGLGESEIRDLIDTKAKAANDRDWFNLLGIDEDTDAAQIQKAFFEIVTGEVEDPYGWLTSVY